jgi:hypothetical protein
MARVSLLHPGHPDIVDVHSVSRSALSQGEQRVETKERSGITLRPQLGWDLPLDFDRELVQVGHAVNCRLR